MEFNDAKHISKTTSHRARSRAALRNKTTNAHGLAIQRYWAKIPQAQPARSLPAK